jgi:hypothetical protein
VGYNERMAKKEILNKTANPTADVSRPLCRCLPLVRPHSIGHLLARLGVRRWLSEGGPRHDEGTDDD